MEGDRRVITWKLNALLGDCKDVGRPVTYRDISTATGLSTSTLYMIASNRNTRTDLETIELLLNFFSDRLGKSLETGHLLYYEKS